MSKNLNNLAIPALVLLFILAKFWYAQATPSALRPLLAPVSMAVGAFTNAPGHRTPSGYLHPDAGILIEKSCSGFNFLLLVMSLFSARQFFIAPISNRFFWPFAAASSFSWTILVNSCRILLSLNLSQFLKAAGQSPPAWLHEATGIFVFLSALCTTWLLLLRWKPASRHPSGAQLQLSRK